jgi:hypothetical protein
MKEVINLQYIKCIWFHNSSEYPILLYSELDEERYESRKIEIYRNHRIGYATIDTKHNGTELGEAPVPETEEINRDIEFYAVQITREEFEIVWKDLIS